MRKIVITMICLFSCLLVRAGKCTTETHGTICSNSNFDLMDDRFAAMLNILLPANNAHSTLVVFTQCYGGDAMDDLASRPNTAVVSATSPGQTATYGGYDDDAAAALRPGAGRTSNDVHEAGVAGKASGETPQSQGSPVSLEPTNPDGPIRSRHVLIYAGIPGGGSHGDAYQRDVIRSNFAGQGNTTVTAVGGDGTGGWDYPGTIDGLNAAALALMNEMDTDEQLIVFVTDHGDIEKVDTSPDCASGHCVSEPLILGESIYAQMLSDPQNIPTVALFSPGPMVPPPVDILVGDQLFPAVPFDQFVDLNGDGDMNDFGEGWAAVHPMDEASIDPMGEIVMVMGPGEIALATISLGSGAIAKNHVFGCLYVPGDINNSNTFTGLDITYAVRFFKGGPLPPYSCECPPGHTWYVSGDVNGSCTFTGLDITYMVRYFKGGPAPIPCPDCPPAR
jgi:hypothetical protein